MKAALATLTALAAIAAAADADARRSTYSEARGLDNCVAEAKSTSDKLVTERYYFVDHTGSETQYYVNGTRWENGERARVRIACTTSRSGHKLMSAAVEPGRYTNASVRVEVAKK